MKNSKQNDLIQFGSDYKIRVEKAIQYLQKGKGILLVDDENRENEGDLIFSAEHMQIEDMALMIRECSGIVCLCLTEERIEELGLLPMVSNNTSKYQTAFTVSIEAKNNVTTGVSASDRIQTIQTACALNAMADDLAKPGHVFPLKAVQGGVFKRRGHTEGSIDLMKLAGMQPAAVLCELTNTNGTMARLPEIADFAKKHNTMVVSIEDVFQYRTLVQDYI